MSKLEQLIQELCPNGVEHKKFGEIAKIVRGASPRPISQYVTNDENSVNWIKIGDVKPDSKYITETKEKITQEGAKKSRHVEIGDFIMSNSMSFGRPYILKINGCIHDGWLSISEFNDYVTSDYLYYLLNSSTVQKQMNQKVSKGTVRNLNADIVKALKIPVPPLEIQCEIVRILDNFTELTARKKQYEYYRDTLLQQDIKAQKMRLKELVNMFKGEYITQKNTRIGDVPVILGGQEPAYYIDRHNHVGEIVVVSRSGASAGFVSYWNEPIFITDGFGLEAKTEYIAPKYLYYALKSKETKLNKMKRGAGIPHISGQALLDIELFVPPIKTQHKIVHVLDNFDSICADLKIGLPAEIEARKKQYEYYRDVLLPWCIHVYYRSNL